MILRIIFLTILSVNIVGCANYSSAPKNKVDPSTYQKPHSQYKHMLHKISKNVPKMSMKEKEEYIQRVSKRIALVSDTPSLSLKVNIADSEHIFLELNSNDSITISKGYLRHVKSEAQLAAVIGQIISSLQSKDNIDRNSMEYMARAGYDPKALVELQRHALNTNNYMLQSPIHSKVTQAMIFDNVKYSKKFPSGLKTNEFDFQKMFLDSE